MVGQQMQLEQVKNRWQPLVDEKQLHDGGVQIRMTKKTASFLPSMRTQCATASFIYAQNLTYGER